MAVIRAVVAAAVALAVAGCAVGSSPTTTPTPTAAPTPTPLGSAAAAAAAEVCAARAAFYNGTVAASFATTVGALRADPQLELSLNPDLWAGVADSEPAVLCFIVGEIGKAPPPPPPPATPWPSFDRAVIGLVQGQPDLFIAGYRSNLPIQAP